MTQLPPWTFLGTVPLTDDLSVLEAALHSGRVAAAEQGYLAEPVSIDTLEAMQVGDTGDAEVDLVTAEEAEAQGIEFAPTVRQFRMEWAGETGAAASGDDAIDDVASGDVASGDVASGDVASGGTSGAVASGGASEPAASGGVIGGEAAVER